MRYIVMKTAVMSGAPMFQVWDSWNGTECGSLHYWRDDAERAAYRLNMQDREERAESFAIYETIRARGAAHDCKHPNAKCVYDSDDGEYEKWECPDCGKRYGVEIPQ